MYIRFSIQLVDGGWSSWKEWSGECGPCSGPVRRFRNCTEPAPQFEGLSCPGEAEEIMDCGNEQCEREYF